MLHILGLSVEGEIGSLVRVSHRVAHCGAVLHSLEERVALMGIGSALRNRGDQGGLARAHREESVAVFRKKKKTKKLKYSVDVKVFSYSCFC